MSNYSPSYNPSYEAAILAGFANNPPDSNLLDVDENFIVTNETNDSYILTTAIKQSMQTK
jgi:hypothetical protein